MGWDGDFFRAAERLLALSRGWTTCCSVVVHGPASEWLLRLSLLCVLFAFSQHGRRGNWRLRAGSGRSRESSAASRIHQSAGIYSTRYMATRWPEWRHIISPEDCKRIGLYVASSRFIITSKIWSRMTLMINGKISKQHPSISPIPSLV